MNRIERDKYTHVCTPSCRGYFGCSYGKLVTIHDTKPYKPGGARDHKHFPGLVILADYEARWPYRDQAWRFDVGAYGDHSVVVWARGVEDALEKASEFVAEYWPGLMTEPDYEDAAKELGLDVNTDDDEEQEQIREHAEADLTYTESGYLASWEWYIRELEREDILQEILDANERGRDVAVVV
jgi:hypothetical protein